MLVVNICHLYCCHTVARRNSTSLPGGMRQYILKGEIAPPDEGNAVLVRLPKPREFLAPKSLTWGAAVYDCDRAGLREHLQNAFDKLDLIGLHGDHGVACRQRRIKAAL